MTMRQAKGTKDPFNENMRQIAIRFSNEQFDKIVEQAAKREISFAQYVRDVVEESLRNPETT